MTTGWVAMIGGDPAATAVARPAELTVAAPTFEDFQATRLVTFCAGPALKLAVAVNCTEQGKAHEGVVRVSAMEVRSTGFNSPVPLRGTVCGEPAALSVMVKVPLRVPVANGAKTTSI